MSRLAGAYGLALASSALKTHRLGKVDANAEAWALSAEAVRNDVPPTAVDAAATDGDTVSQLARFHPIEMTEDHATLVLDDGTLTLDRSARTAHLAHVGSLDPELLVHPLLAGVGIVAAHWGRRAPLHAGAVLVDGQAWAVLAERENGKSTTMAALEQAGFTVLTDDLLVVDGDVHAHVGPRCLDLRPESAPMFPSASIIGDRGGRERHRLGLGPAPAHAPLSGFIRLAWTPGTGATGSDSIGGPVSLTPVAPASRLAVVAASLSMHAPVANPLLMLDLAALPSFVLQRPKDLSSLPAVVDAFSSLGQLAP